MFFPKSRFTFDKLYSAIITIDKEQNRERITTLLPQLKQHLGITNPHIWYGEIITNREKNRDKLIFKTHKELCEWVVKDSYIYNNYKYLIIFEDDALIVNTKIK